MIEKKFFKDILFLSDLPDPIMEKIASIATLKVYDKDTILFHQGQDITHLFMLVSGKVHFTLQAPSGKTLIVDKIYEGKTFGVYALMEDPSSPYTVLCAEKSTIISISAKQMQQLFEEDFKLGHLLMLKVVKLFKKRMELHTRQFLLSLMSNSEIS
jgi:CRP-like cAMP-binding protein